MKKCILIGFIGLLFSCRNPIADSFKIESKSYFKPLNKLEMNVIVETRLGKSKLEEISNYIQTQNRDCEIIMIFFYTPDLKIGEGAYAVATFNPMLNLKVQRASEEQNKLMENTGIENGQFIGKWRDNTLTMERTIYIYTINDTLKMRSIYKDQSYGDELISKSKDNNNKTRFNLKDNKEEWYILEANGNLSAYGVNGKYNEMKELK